MAAKVVRLFSTEGKGAGPQCLLCLAALVAVVEVQTIKGGAGGGGGYSGGSSGAGVSDSCGGGGGSFNSGRDQQNECCYNSDGHGQVTVTLLKGN